MQTAFAPPPQTTSAPGIPVGVPPAAPSGMPVSGGFLQGGAPQQPTPQMQMMASQSSAGVPMAAADNRIDTSGGGYIMPPTGPTTLPGQQVARPTWPSYQQATQQQPQQQVFQQQQPVYQQQPVQAAPAPPFMPMQQPMAHDPLHVPGAYHQFNDGLALAGPAGGGPPASVQGVPAGTSAALMPAGRPQQQQFPQQQPTLIGGTPDRAIVSRLLNQGLAVQQYQSDDQLLHDIGQMVSQQQQLQPILRLGYEALERQRGAANQPPAGGPAPQTANAVPPASPGQQPAQPQRPAAPEWRPEWERLVRLDERTGQFVAVDPMVTNPIVVERANEYAAWRRQRADAMLRDPVGTVLAEGLEQRLAQMRDQIRQELQQETVQQQQAAEAERITEQFLEQHKQAFFHLDANGQPAVNPVTGQFAMTPVGAAAAHHAGTFRQSFVNRYGHEPHPLDVTNYVRQSLASDQARGVFGQQVIPVQTHAGIPAGVPAQPQQQLLVGPGGAPMQVAPQQPPQNMIGQAAQFAGSGQMGRMQAMNGGAYQPNQLGTIAAAAQQPEYDQNPHLSFRDRLFNAAKQRGLMPANA